MSWLPNPFKSLRISDEKTLSETTVVSGGGGVKEDLSELGETIGRQLRGVAAFLAPPPRLSSPSTVGHVADEQSGDIHSPKLEIGGSFKSSLSILSSKQAATGTSETNSGLLRWNEVGITKEVVDFVTDVSEWPECWTDFPLSLNDVGFSMSQTQAEHISAIQQIVPSFTDLKTTLRNDMNERKFWMIYFILLIPRLNENSLRLLSTPEVTETRDLLLTKVRNKRKSLTREISEEKSGESMVCIQGSGEKVVEAEDSPKYFQKEDGICFSDWDGDDTDFSNRVHAAGSCSSDGSNSDWVRLKKKGGGRTRKGQLNLRNTDSEVEESSSDWLTIHEFDYYK